ncbi:MAG: DUF4403 family protein [Bacteroidota bacterium]
MTTQPSIIRIPVNINLPNLERALNEQFAGSLYQDDTFEDGDKMKVTAEKDGDIKLAVEGMAINYQVPLALWIEYDLGITRVQATGRLNLDLKTAFDIDRNWQLSTQTALQEYEWKEKPRIRFGGVSIPASAIANAILRRSEAMISDNIDEAVATNFRLEDYVGSAWNLMFKAYEVSPEYQTWLLVNPKDLGMTPIQVIDDQMQATILVQSQPELRFGNEPASSSYQPLPPFTYRNLNPDAERGFEIFLDATLSYAEAERLTRENLVGERFEQGKRYVVVDDVQLYGQGRKLVVDLRLSGSYNGSIFLTGEPTFNERRNRIEIDNLEYTLDTKNFLVKSAAWLAKGTIKQKLQENMDYLLDYNLRDAREQMQEQLGGYSLGPGVLLNGELETLDLHNAYLTPNGIKVVMAFRGELGVEVDGL